MEHPTTVWTDVMRILGSGGVTTAGILLGYGLMILIVWVWGGEE